MTSRTPAYVKCRCGHGSGHHVPSAVLGSSTQVQLGRCSKCSCEIFEPMEDNILSLDHAIEIRNTIAILDNVTRNGYGRIPAWVYNDICDARKRLEGLLAEAT